VEHKKNYCRILVGKPLRKGPLRRRDGGRIILRVILDRLWVWEVGANVQYLMPNSALPFSSTEPSDPATTASAFFSEDVKFVLHLIELLNSYRCPNNSVVQRWTTGWMIGGSGPGRDWEFFSSPRLPDRLWGSTNLLPNGNQDLFPWE
jgi:hypothetical protein